MRTVVPETDDGRVGFVTVRNNLVVGFEETEDRRDDDVKRDNDMIGLYGSPLEVVLCPDLNGRGEGEGEGYDRFVISKVE